MNTSVSGINLASQPFGRERAQTALLAAIAGALAILLLVWLALIFKEHRQTAVLHRTIDRDRRELTQVQHEQSRFETVIGRPRNADVFSKSVFDNELISRRAVSWTHVFGDLEKVMPVTMRLVSIRLPQVAAETEGTNHIQLDMIVGTLDPHSLAQLLKRLEGSTLFGAATVLSQQPPSQNDPSFRYRVSVPYAQKF